ncbi:MAG: SGNH/GDSL hydrolase family protein [Oscillospiraceae bacterium]
MFKRLISTTLIASIILSTQSMIMNTQEVNAITQDTIKIMSVGDSITDGYWEQGGYRKYMYHSLEENGITNIDMVGAKGMNEESYSDGEVSFTYDGNYSGYSGYAIQYIEGTETRQGILETMQSETYGDNGNQNMMDAYQPDIVLLQIGTNDILSAYNDGITDRLENLCNYILSYLNEDDTLFVSTIPDIDVEEVYTWLWAYGSDGYYTLSHEEFAEKVQNYIDVYNTSIKDMVERKQSEGVSNIKFADINSVVDYQTDLYDGVHPNEQGYQKMGEYWSSVLVEYLNGESVEPPVTTTSETITTTEVTTITDITDITTIETTTEQTDIKTETTIMTTEPPIIEFLKGDINADGLVSYMDLLLLKRRILTNLIDWVVLYDINDDGKVNTLDVVDLKSILFNYDN